MNPPRPRRSRGLRPNLHRKLPEFAPVSLMPSPNHVRRAVGPRLAAPPRGTWRLVGPRPAVARAWPTLRWMARDCSHDPNYAPKTQVKPHGNRTERIRAGRNLLRRELSVPRNAVRARSDARRRGCFHRHGQNRDRRARVRRSGSEVRPVHEAPVPSPGTPPGLHGTGSRRHGSYRRDPTAFEDEEPRRCRAVRDDAELRRGRHRTARRNGGRRIMEALKADVTQGLSKGSLLNCADNTGAREVKVISVSGYSGTKSRHPKAGIGDKVTVSVTKGTPEMRRQVLEAVVVRQRKPIRRPDGTRVKFEDNAAVIIDDVEEPRGTEIKGPIAREVAERFGSIASTATMIV